MLTGARLEQNVPQAAPGPLRLLLTECTRHDPADRPQTVAEVMERLEDLLTRAPVAPMDEARVALERLAQGRGSAAELMRIAADHPDDAELFVDILATAPLDLVRGEVESDPPGLSALASTMLGHLTTINWGDRSFDYANVPLRWGFTVLDALIDLDELGLAEDVAVDQFRAELQWNRFRQHDITAAWLTRLADPAGEHVARAIRRANAIEYYRDAARSRPPRRAAVRSVFA